MRLRDPILVAIVVLAGLALPGGAQAGTAYLAGSIIPFTDPAGGALGALGTAANGAVVEFERNTAGTWTSSAVAGAGAVAGPVVPDNDPGGGGLIAFAQSPSGDFLQFARSSTGTWTQYDMSSLFKLGPVAGQVLPYSDPLGGGLIAYAASPSGDFIQFARSPTTGSWTAYDMTSMFSLGQVSGMVVPYTDPGNSWLLAFAQSPSGDFVQFGRNPSNGSWTGYDLTSMFSLSKVVGPVLPYTDPGSGWLLAFARSPSGDFLQFARNPSNGSWTGYDMTSLFSLSKVSGPVVPYTDPASHQLLAFARSPTGDLLVFVRNSSTGSWTDYDLSDLDALGPVSGTVTPYTDPSTHALLVFATDANGDALEIARGANGAWSAVPIPTPPVVEPVAVSQPLPVPPTRSHGGKRALRVRFVLDWTWDHARTRLRSIRVAGVPRKARIEVRCRGRGCPRGAVTADYRRLAGFRRTLEGRVFRAGDVITITVSAPRRRAERIRVRIRDGKEPEAHLV